MSSKRDLFMELPDCLLYIIISFLPFKDAAKTSILSKRWLTVWHATRNIEFDESFFVKHEESDVGKAIKRRDFIDFVHRWVGNYSEPSIDKFSLKFSNPEQFVSDMRNFIDFAITKNVKGLSLDFSDPSWEENNLEDHKPLFDLPSAVYKNKEVLASLKLFACKIDVPSFKSFNLLKDLSLGWIELNEESFKTLLQNCPLLENLSLSNCWNIKEIFLSNQLSSLLKKLMIYKCSFSDPNCICISNSPELRVFKYSGSVGYFVLDNLCCLEEAMLDFGLETTCGVFSHLLYNLLLDLFSVTSLTVCSFMLQVIPQSEEIFGTEIPLNVRHLTLNIALHSHEFYGITFFLNSCPLLETLTIDLCDVKVLPDYEPPFEFNNTDFWTKNLFVYKCMRKTLKAVEVKGFTGTTNQFLVLRYFIWLGRVMEQLNLYLSREPSDEGNVESYRARAQKLMQLKKASKKLHISIY